MTSRNDPGRVFPFDFSSILSPAPVTTTFGRSVDRANGPPGLDPKGSRMITGEVLRFHVRYGAGSRPRGHGATGWYRGWHWERRWEGRQVGWLSWGGGGSKERVMDIMGRDLETFPRDPSAFSGTVIGDYVCRRQEGPVIPSEKVCGSLGIQNTLTPVRQESHRVGWF